MTNDENIFKLHKYDKSENMSVPPSSTSLGLPRAIYPLVLLYSMSNMEIEGKTKLEKLIFVIQKRLIEELKWGITGSNYDFRAFNFGPFTEEVYDDVASLKLLSLVNVVGEGDNQKYSLTEKGKTVVESLIAQKRLNSDFISEIAKIAKNFGELRLDKLIEKVYKEYPEYARNSLIKSRYSF